MASFPELCQSEKRHFSFLRCLLGPPTNLGRAFQSALGARASNINAEVEPQRGRMGRGPSAGAGHEIHGFYNGLPSGCYIPDIPGMLEILMLWKMDEHGLFLELVLDSQGNCGDV